MPEKIRIAMLGGGPGSMIGPVHRAAMRMTDKYELVAGIFSSDRQRSLQLAESLGIPAENVYADYKELAKDAEKLRLDAVTITTPNHLHVSAALAFVNRKVHVMCEKPLSANWEGVRHLEQRVLHGNVVFGLAHPYSAYPVVRHAQQLVADGKLGEIKLVAVEYLQGWLTELLEKDPANKGAVWRENLQLGGAGGVVGDIGTHAFQLVEFVSGLRVQSVLADVTSLPGRRVPDDAKLLLRFHGGATGSLWCSQVATGALNGLRLRIYGEKGSLEWAQQRPEELRLVSADNTETIYHKGQTGEGTLPPGHPEGYYEGFAQLYNEFADEIIRRKGRPDGSAGANTSKLPDLATGVRGLRFIDTAVESSFLGNVWVKLDLSSPNAQ